MIRRVAAAAVFIVLFAHVPAGAARRANMRQCGAPGGVATTGMVNGNLQLGFPQQASLELFTDSPETRRYIGDIHSAAKAETIAAGSGDILAKIKAIADRPIESSSGSVYPMLTDRMGRFSCGGLPYGNYDLIAMYFARAKNRIFSVHSVAQIQLTRERPSARVNPSSFQEISRR